VAAVVDDVEGAVHRHQVREELGVGLAAGVDADTALG
jgi:hypothetical protein